MAITIHKLTKHFAAEIAGVDLTQPLDGATIEALKTALAVA